MRSGDITATLRTMLAREAGAKLKETIAKTVSSALGAVMVTNITGNATAKIHIALNVVIADGATDAI